MPLWTWTILLKISAPNHLGNAQIDPAFFKLGLPLSLSTNLFSSSTLQNDNRNINGNVKFPQRPKQTYQPVCSPPPLWRCSISSELCLIFWQIKWKPIDINTPISKGSFWTSVSLNPDSYSKQQSLENCLSVPVKLLNQPILLLHPEGGLISWIGTVWKLFWMAGP